MSSAFRWKRAWEEYGEEHPDLRGQEHYRLPHHGTIIPGDKFWSTEDHVLYTVTSVQTKVYQGVVAPQGEEGDDHVFLEPDWTEPDFYGHKEDVEEFIFPSVDEFVQELDDGRFDKHAGNGIWLP